MTNPTGIGMWIAYPHQAENGDAGKIAARCILTHVSWLAIRANFQDEIDWIRDSIPIFEREGIAVYAWRYAYPGQDARQIECARSMIDAGCAGYIIDAEIEYCGRRDDAKSLVDALRGIAPPPWLAYAPFAFPLSHRDYPYAEFGSLDACMPQLYWTLFNDRGAMKNILDFTAQWKVFMARNPNHTKNILPVAASYGTGSDYDRPMGSLKKDDISYFMNTYPNMPVSWYSYEAAQPVLLDYLFNL